MGIAINRPKNASGDMKGKMSAVDMIGFLADGL
jgi:hypothetical protein